MVGLRWKNLVIGLGDRAGFNSHRGVGPVRHRRHAGTGTPRHRRHGTLQLDARSGLGAGGMECGGYDGRAMTGGMACGGMWRHVEACGGISCGGGQEMDSRSVSMPSSRSLHPDTSTQVFSTPSVTQRKPQTTCHPHTHGTPGTTTAYPPHTHTIPTDLITCCWCRVLTVLMDVVARDLWRQEVLGQGGPGDILGGS